MSLTIKKIAEIAGVSVGTVDRVINNRGNVRYEVAERIKKIIKELGYVPNFSAKSLALKVRSMKIGVVFHTKGPYFNTEILNGIAQAKKELSDFGIEIIVRSSKNFDANDQLEIIDELMSMGINAIAITPINTSVVAKKIDELISSGFPVFCFINDIKCSNAHPYIGNNAEETGRMVAGLFNMLSDGDGDTLGVISPSFKILGHKQKIIGLKNALLNDYPHIHLTDVCELNDTNDISVYKDVKEYLINHPKISMLWYATSVSDGGITALQEQGLLGKCRIITLNVQQFISVGLEERYIDATIGQNPYTQGYQTMKIIFNSLLKDEYPSELSFTVPCEIFIKENYPKVHID